MKLRRKIAAVTSAGVLAFTLAACDGGGSAEPDGNAGEPTPTAPPTNDDQTGADSDEADDDTLDEAEVDDDGEDGGEANEDRN